MAPHFPSEWRIVMVDMPGHGESSFISGDDYSSKGMARKLHDVREWKQVVKSGVEASSEDGERADTINENGYLVVLSLFCIQCQATALAYN